MPHSFSAMWFHIIFATNKRHPWLTKDVRSLVHGYMHGVIGNIGGTVKAIGGVEDHVHLLIRLTPEVSVSDCIRVLKASTSKWIHGQYPALQGFAWQVGFSVFTVSCSQFGRVADYIARQEDHHQVQGYLGELRAFLERHGVGYDERDVQK